MPPSPLAQERVGRDLAQPDLSSNLSGQLQALSSDAIADENVSVPHAQALENIESQPLTKFHPFKRLPIEIRLKIYRITFSFPRIIELQAGPGRRNVSRRRTYQACPRSRIPPSILGVWSESRIEAMKFYEKRVFKPLSERKDDSPYIWYNPHVDIVVFGGFGRAAFVKLCETGEQIPRLGWHMKGPNPNSDYIIDILRGLPTAAAPQITPDPARPSIGVREIFLVVPSQLYHVEPGQIASNVEFRPATCEGRNRREVIETRETRYIFEKCQRGDRSWHGAPLPLPSNVKDEWAEGRMPDIQFVSLTPSATDNEPTVLDGMSIYDQFHHAVVPLLTSKFYSDFEHAFGCQLIVNAKVDTKGQEIGFFGSKSAVEKAKIGAIEYFRSTLEALRASRTQSIQIHGAALTRIFVD
ncbi:uncharacterized protein PAC_05782 [Phialocephala subalpina]|uniref:2EXR domain-containing protein n=1 Tax=Phialocephala subalpina TaxID=576137 RepID=A0A1L7WT00_9HELO|nr:uncharacterized protein PAC_05782 [Phialocephala subalpina]